MIKPNPKAQAILNHLNYATLATVDPSGSPWNAPVYFVCDENSNIYWASHDQSQHSQNIQANSKVFIVVYDSTASWGAGVGVYVAAKAFEVTDPQVVAKVCQLREARMPKANQPPEAFMGDSPRRIYSAQPQSIWMNEAGKKDGQFIDVRIEAEEV